MLSTLANSGLSVATIEDPVRHVIKGAHQTQVNHKNGLTTEMGLRNILLQDADAILIQPLHLKNISELIETTIQKGHLLFGSLHAADSAEAIHHLVNSGLDKYTAAKHIQLAITHDQVRTLCNNCKQAYAPSQEEVKMLLREFSNNENLAIERLHILEMAAKDSGIAAERKLSTTYGKIEQLWKARPNGCQNCNYKGYKGSIGVFEIVQNGIELQKILLANLGRQSLRNEIKRSLALSTKQDAIIKMLRGLTSMNEVMQLQTIKEQD
jgi:type II secretory ATPase GspE/PulE/Tfp pilus assembly ATPase PilB-like protein